MSLRLSLTSEQFAELNDVVHHHHKPYMRERAAALLKIASGQTARQVAQEGLLQSRKPHTVSDWYDRYKQEGIKGLEIKKGRGRKASFSPEHHPGQPPDQPPEPSTSSDRASEVRLATELVVRQSPAQYGFSHSRWRLQDLLQVCSWLHVKSTSGLWNWLHTWNIRYKRGRAHVHSPDVNYQDKLDLIRNKLSQFDLQNDVLLFMDELTVFTHPTVAQAYSCHHEQPYAEQGYQPNRSFRIVAVLNGFTGQVSFMIRNKITTATLVSFYEELSRQYAAKNIYLVQDNWPVHYHADVMGALVPQDLPFGLVLSKSWQMIQPKKKYLGKNLPIHFLALPTYASWLNPIEKVWKKLKKEIIHHHRFKDGLAELKSHVVTWLQSFQQPSLELYRYVGLLCENSFWFQSFKQIHAFNQNYVLGQFQDTG